MFEFLKYFPGNQILVSINEKQGGDVKHYYTIPENLNQINKIDYGIYFAVNNLDRSKDPSKQRTIKMFVNARAIWIDDDVIRPACREDFPVPPNLIVNTSPGKYHYYWLTTTSNLEEWQGVMETMVQQHGCDKSSKDAARILRIPGFYHNKKEPYLITHQVLSETPYSWEEILKHFPPSKKDVGKSIEYYKKLYGEGHRHTPSRGLAMKFAENGVPRNIAVELIQTMCPEEDTKHHEQSVSSAYDKVKEERTFDLPEKIYDQNKIDFPPGLIGQLSKEIYEKAYHPNVSVSIVTAFGLIAGIVGRKFNVSQGGLNLYITLLMETGQGKDVINKVIGNVLQEAVPSVSCDYIGGSSFTGSKALWKCLLKGMSRICVMTEAGILQEVKAGNQPSLLRAILNLYSSSGKHNYMQQEFFSHEEDGLPSLRSPALSIIAESTPKVFIDQMISNGGDINGSLARMWFVKLNEDKPFINRSMRKDFSSEIMNRIKDLCIFCHDAQNEKLECEVVNVEMPDYMYDISDDLTRIENEAGRSGNLFKKVMASRAFVKLIRISAIIEVFNNFEKEKRDYCISEETKDWVLKNIIEIELKGIEDMIGENDGNDTYSLIENVVTPTLRKMMAGELKDKGSPNEAMRKNFCFTKSNFVQALRRNKTISRLNNSKYAEIKTGLDKILDFMVKNNMIQKIERKNYVKFGCDDNRIKDVYRIDRNILTFIS